MNEALVASGQVTTIRDSPRNSSILQQLKQKTATQHRRLESEADLWPSLCSLTDYGRLIVRMFGIYEAFESRLKAVENLPIFVPDLADRWKGQMLRRDMAALGLSAESVVVCRDVVEMRTVPAALGCLYVLEGSTLGGQFISREVQAKLGFTSERGCGFFSSYGPKVGSMWKAFGESLESFCAAHPACQDEIVGSAVATFEVFTRWLAGDKLVSQSRTA